jgi:hypothetical protein
MEHQIVLVEDPPGKGNGFVLWMRDMNGDSSPDLVASRIPIQHPELGSSEVVLVYLKAGEAPKVETITAGMIGLNKFLGPINVGDVDGDGGQDLLIVPGGLPVEGPVAFLRRSVDGKILSITDSWPKGSTGFGWQSSQSEVLDLDGDGRAELFHYPYLSDMGQAPSVQVPFESISWDGSSWNPTKLTFSPKSKGTFLDLNEDGVTDFVNPGEMWFNKNKGFYEKKDFEGSAAPRDGTIDLDLDGNIDLPAGGWYRGNGFGHFENGSPILYEETQASVGSARFADFSGDGVYDIVNQGGGGTISCHINIGKPILK